METALECYRCQRLTDICESTAELAEFLEKDRWLLTGDGYWICPQCTSGYSTADLVGLLGRGER